MGRKQPKVSITNWCTSAADLAWSEINALPTAHSLFHTMASLRHVSTCVSVHATCPPMFTLHRLHCRRLVVELCFCIHMKCLLQLKFTWTEFSCTSSGQMGFLFQYKAPHIDLCFEHESEQMGFPSRTNGLLLQQDFKQFGEVHVLQETLQERGFKHTAYSTCLINSFECTSRLR